MKSKVSSIVPTGALIIAPDGEVLNVGGPTGHSDSGELTHLDKILTEILTRTNSPR